MRQITTPQTLAEKFLLEASLPSETLRQDWMARSFVKNEWKIRQEYIKSFGFAVLDHRVIVTVLSFSPILEVGAGSGYWAYELRRNGADVVATDPRLSRYGSFGSFGRWSHEYVEIIELTGPDAVVSFPNRTLLIAWPDFDNKWAVETVKVYKGTTVLYVGEAEGGCTADEEFHHYLTKTFVLHDTIKIPQFGGIHDALFVYKRGIN